jgi:8-oxo-dGTP diphosphatase
MHMKREYPDTPFVGVGVVIIEDGRVALIKRGQAPLLGEWSIPGGVLEVGELLRQAAIREAHEETGLTVEPGELLGVYDRVLRDECGNTMYHYVLIDFLCRRVAGQAIAGGDAAEVAWFTRDDFERLALARETAEVVRLGFERTEKQ